MVLRLIRDKVRDITKEKKSDKNFFNLESCGKDIMAMIKDFA